MSVDAPDDREVLLEVSGLTVAFPTVESMLLAVNGVSLTLRAGQVLGLVGESGCGKSVALRSLLHLVPYPGEIVDGTITWRGQEVTAVDRRAIERLRGREISMIFQDPTSSLNPVFTIGDQLTETLRLRLGMSRGDARRRAVELLERVGIPSAAQRLRSYPHELSGGMRQRVMIAIAIAPGPRLLLADEPTTALDVTIQGQILELLDDLRRETGMAMVLVSHDIGVVAERSEQVAVMYAGRIVESGSVSDVVDRARHPYTRGLLGAVPSIRPRAAHRLTPIAGQPPELGQAATGCPFRPRCPHARDQCVEVPMVLDAALPAHGSACPMVGEPRGEAVASIHGDGKVR